MIATTKSTVLKISKHLFAVNGYEGFSIRTLVKQSGIGQSSIYHLFKNKDEILKVIYETSNRELGIARSKLPISNSAEEMLLNIIRFQFQHIEDIVFVLKYYLHFRPDFLKLDVGYLPTKGYLHIEEVLRAGIEGGEFIFDVSEIQKESKVIAHAINGFLLEYYPNSPKKNELADVTASIHKFLMRSLTNKEVAMK